MNKAIVLSLVCAVGALASYAAQPFGVNDLLGLKRIADPEVSPDGKWVAYTVREPDIDANKFKSHIWIVSTDGGEPRQLTSHEKGESRAKWSPDGKSIAFLSARSGSQQVWLLPMEGGGEARQLTSLSTEADNHIWSPTGDAIAFTSDVWPDLPDDAAQKKRADERESSGVKAQVIDSLLYRHWTEWRHGKRSHIFITSIATNAPRDLTPGDLESPPFSMSSGHLFDISPDGKTLAFTRGPARATEAWSTDTAICIVPTAGGTITDLTVANKGADTAPYFSPDGKYIAFKSQERDGYEADRTRLGLIDVAGRSVKYLAGNMDFPVEEIAWAPDSKTLHFTIERRGGFALFTTDASGGGEPRERFAASHFGSLSLPKNGDFVVYSTDTLTRAPELAKRGFSGEAKTLTRVNDAVFTNRAVASVEEIHYKGARGADIQAWVLKPPGFDAAKKYPCLLLIHGGPQSAWLNAFSYRWNLMTYAAQGYVVVAPNPHGSSGFGQAFTEQISGDWGGAVYEDVMKAADWAAAQPYIDASRMGAAGASFGGYMVNWILGHTDRFKCLVSHAGVYNLDSEYGVTEELWFPEWEFKGPPWKNREMYDKFSPHRYAANFKTPTLVTHGELDYRVPIDQGLQLFTALQRQGVPSRLLYYPDEGHWVLKLKNSRLYYETVLKWLDDYLQPGKS